VSISYKQGSTYSQEEEEYEEYSEYQEEEYQDYSLEESYWEEGDILLE
jgi:hypothetical protein